MRRDLCERFLQQNFNDKEAVDLCGQLLKNTNENRQES